MENGALIGIDPKTRVCVSVGPNTLEISEDMRADGLICVPCSKDTAKGLWGTVIADIYWLGLASAEVE